MPYNPARRLLSFGGDGHHGSDGHQDSSSTHKSKSKKQSSRNTIIDSNSNSMNDSSPPLAYASANANTVKAIYSNAAAAAKPSLNVGNTGSIGRSASDASSAMSGSHDVSTLGGATSVGSNSLVGNKIQPVGKQQAPPPRVDSHSFDSSPGTGNEREDFVTTREPLNNSSSRATGGGQQGQTYTSSGPLQSGNDSHDDIRRSNDAQFANKTGSEGHGSNDKASHNRSCGVMSRSNTGDISQTGRSDSALAGRRGSDQGGPPKSKPEAYAESVASDSEDEECDQSIRDPSIRNSEGGRVSHGGSGGGGTLDGKGLQTVKEGIKTNATSSSISARGRSSNEDFVSPSLSRTMTMPATTTTTHKTEPVAQAGDFADKEAEHVFLSAALGNGTNRQPVTRFRIHTANLQVHCAALMELASGGKQEVQLEEDVATLKLLFGLMYNMPSPELSEHDWQVVLRLARCAHRFDVARAMEVAATYFTEQEQVGTLSPFMTFAFAIKYKMQKLEEAAAERLVRFDTGRVPELVFNMMGFNAFQRLVAFHNRRQAFYQDTLSNISIDPKDLADQCYQTGGICVVAPLARLKRKLAWPSQAERDGTKQTTPDNASLLRQLVSEIGLIDCGTCSRALCEAALEMQVALECLPRYSERSGEAQQAGR